MLVGMGTGIKRLEDIATNELKVDFPKARFAVTWKQAVAAAGLAAAVGSILWFRQPEPPPTVGSAAERMGVGASLAPGDKTTPEDNNASDQGTRSSEVVVSVIGAVERPGLYTFAPGARVADALDAAVVFGNTFGLNHAAVLEDASQIFVPAHGVEPSTENAEVASLVVGSSGGYAAEGSGTGGSSEGESNGKISLNKATLAELTSLPGVGDKTAQAIINYRESNGPFTDISQLQQVKGIGPAKFDALQGQVSL